MYLHRVINSILIYLALYVIYRNLIINMTVLPAVRMRPRGRLCLILPPYLILSYSFESNYLIISSGSIVHLDLFGSGVLVFSESVQLSSSIFKLLTGGGD